MILPNTVIQAINPTNNTSFCQVTSDIFGYPDFGVTQFYSHMGAVIDSATVILQTSSGTAAGTVDVQSLTMQTVASSSTWIGTGTTPTNMPAQVFPWTVIASTTIKVPLTIANAAYGPAIGLRLISSGLVGVSITYAQFVITWR